MLHEKLTQAEMLVNYRTMLHKANRCTKADLDKAIDELEAIRLEIEKGITPPVAFIPPIIETQPVEDFDKTMYQLSADARILSKEQGEISNQIVAAYRAGEKDVSTLMNQAISLRKQIESIWDKYYFLKRNGSLPAEKAIEAGFKEVESEESRLGKLVYQQERKLIKDQILKLRKKLEDPTKYVKFDKVPVKKVAWQIELEQLNAKLEQLNINLI